jgi:hypothetical protein
MRETDQLTEDQRTWLSKGHGRGTTALALGIIDDQAARLRAFERDAHYYMGTLARIDDALTAWSRVDAKGNEEDAKEGAFDCLEALIDMLGGYRERVARLRQEAAAAKSPPKEMPHIEITCFDGTIMAVTDGEDDEIAGHRVMAIEITRDAGHEALLRPRDVSRLVDWSMEWLERNRGNS